MEVVKTEREASSPSTATHTSSTLADLEHTAAVWFSTTNTTHNSSTMVMS